MVPFDRSHTSSYSSFVVIVVISCIVSDTEWDSGRKSGFLMPPFYATIIPIGKPVANICVLLQLSQIRGLSGGADRLYTVLCLLTAEACHKRADRQTDGNAISIAECLY